MYFVSYSIATYMYSTSCKIAQSKALDTEYLKNFALKCPVLVKVTEKHVNLNWSLSNTP